MASGSIRLKKFSMTALAAVSCLAILAAFVSATTAQAAQVKTKIQIDRPLVGRGSDQSIYVLIGLEAPAADRDRDRDRPPLNIALVLDRSGSMSGRGKLEYAKQAAGFVVDQLDRRDHLAVIEYDERISVLWPSQRVDATRTIKRLINELTPRGSTNLSGGMMRGVEEVEKTLHRKEFRENAINRVLLLSDGLANRGVTDPHQIRKMVRAAKRDGVRISTLGLGREFDEDLMQDIAENAGGSYTFIEHPNQMARYFEEELNVLFATVLRDARLEFDGGRRIERAQILTYDEASGRRNVDLDLGDFHAKEKRTFVLKLDVEPDAFDRLGTVDLGEITISYRDVETGTERRVTEDVEIEVVADLARAERGINKDVVVETALLETEIKQREAVDLFERGDVKLPIRWKTSFP